MKKLLKYIILCFISLFIILMALNFYVIFSTKNNIVSINFNADNIECIVVLGAGIWGDEPSPMLRDRLDTAIELYMNVISNKIIMSGDHGQDDYDEVNVMKDYAILHGVPSEDIFMDHAGFSTYDSIYRAKEIFGVDKMVIVSQEYHLYRALYIAKTLGIEAYGVNADKKEYKGQWYRELREILARNKDIVKTIFKPEPIYLGDKILISGDGNITNDKE